MHSIVLERGFDMELKEITHDEANKIKARGIQKEDYQNRKDFREVLTFTIDPHDAKDFDDAISFRELSKDKYEIGIHIADVSHYVLPQSHIDSEAKRKSNFDLSSR